MRLVLASNNAGKLIEMQSLFAPLGFDLVTQGSLAITEADEPHPSFIENALAKARHAALGSGGAAIADDSGLCVAALDGAPGVVSAHYAEVELAVAERETQRHAQDAANNALLLQRMSGQADRSARFVCTLVAVRTADDPEPLIATGRWQGMLLDKAQGSGGFGYDPLLFIPALSRSVAELDVATKNTHSHRAFASRQMLALMREVWRGG